MSYYTDDLTVEVIMLKGAKGDPARFEIGTTAQWESDPTFVGEEGQMYVYTDYTSSGGTPIPAMKVGDGETPLHDLPFFAGNRDELAAYMTATDNAIQLLQTAVTGAMHYVGVTTTALTDGSSTNPIQVGGKSYTAKTGDVVIYGSLEFVFSTTDNKWHEYGSTGSLKALAFKDTASGKTTPTGTVSNPNFTGTEGNVSVSGTPTGTVTPTVTVNTATVNSITAVGTLPSLTTSVSGEELTISFSQGTLPTKGADQTVATGIKSATATFSGTAFTSTGKFTPAGSVSQPTFSGNEATVTVS